LYENVNIWSLEWPVWIDELMEYLEGYSEESGLFPVDQVKGEEGGREKGGEADVKGLIKCRCTRW
jgi:hypothetical protein